MYSRTFSVRRRVVMCEWSHCLHDSLSHQPFLEHKTSLSSCCRIDRLKQTQQFCTLSLLCSCCFAVKQTFFGRFSLICWNRFWQIQTSPSFFLQNLGVLFRSSRVWGQTGAVSHWLLLECDLIQIFRPRTVLMPDIVLDNLVLSRYFFLQSKL